MRTPVLRRSTRQAVAGRHVLPVLPALLVAGALLTACGDDDPEAASGGADTCAYVESGTAAAGQSEQPELPEAEPAYDGEVPVSFSTSIGDFGATLDASVAPCTVNSFASLAEQGYFDGTSCHRMTVMTGFEVLQCGDPTGSGSGGPGYTIPDELDGAPEAGADGSAVYPAGTLAMAKAQAPDSGGSQFFMVYGDTQLAPEYTVFGTVDDAGVAAIREAAAAGVTPVSGPQDGQPVTPIDLESVTLD